MIQLSRKAALDLFQHYVLGDVLLVRNRDNAVYFVDCDSFGLIKTENKWEDEKLGFVNQVFTESNVDYAFVSWEDEEPWNIRDILVESGWMGHFIGYQVRPA